MKFVCGGDLHGRRRAPEMRTDDYEEAFFKKLQWVIDYADSIMATAIIFPGDIFDHHDAPDALKERLIKVLRQDGKTCPIPIFIIWGQHDMRYHSSERRNTPLGVLLAGGNGVVRALSATPTILSAGSESAALYGSSWGDDHEPPEDARQGNTIAVWVLHRMIVQDKLWAAQEDFDYGVDFLDEFPQIDLVVSGDNHKTFSETAKVDREGEDVRWASLINSGSIMRANIDQVDHKPCIHVWDSNSKKKPERVYIPVRPAEEVFDLSKVEVVKKRDAKLEAFVDGLGESDAASLDFKANIATYCKDNNIPQGVVDIINEVLA